MSRSCEVAAKLARVRGWLDDSGYGAALISSQPGVAWVTAGLEDRVVRNEEPALVWALVTPAEAWLVTTNIERPRILAEQDTGGFAVHAVPWHQPGGLAAAAEDLAGGVKAGEPPASLRMPLVNEEAERLAVLGADTARGLEGSMRAWQPAERECDTADAAATIAAGTAFAWNPTVRGAKSEDTFICSEIPVPVTNTADWPVVSGGRPAILSIS